MVSPMASPTPAARPHQRSNRNDRRGVSMQCSLPPILAHAAPDVQRDCGVRATLVAAPPRSRPAAPRIRGPAAVARSLDFQTVRRVHMNWKQLGFGLLLADFAAFTGWVIWQYGYIGLFQIALSNAAMVQVTTDLVIACSVGMFWIYNDARTRNVNPWPYLVT